MNCALTNEQQKQLLAKVYKDLQRLAKAEGPFSLEGYVKNFHDIVLNKSKDNALALTYAQLVPEFMNLAFTGRKELKQSLRNKGLSSDALDDMVESFQNINNVIKVIGSPLDQETVDTVQESIAQELEQPAEPEPLTPEEVSAESLEVNKYPYKTSTVLSSTGQEGLVDETGKWTNVKDPEQQFYYDFFDKFSDALDNQGGAADSIEVNGFKGFKLKIVRKNQIPIEVARLDEQRLVRGEKKDSKTGQLISAEQGQRLYYGGVGAAVSSVDGEILYFDQNHNVVSKETPGAKPIYFSLRNVYEENGELQVKGYDVQTVEEIASTMFTPSSSAQSFEELKSVDPALHASLMEKARMIRNTQMTILKTVRDYLRVNKDNEVLADISGVSRGTLDIRNEAGTKIDSIDWANSDVKFNITIADRNNPHINESEGGLYVRVPNHRSIPIQRNNLGAKEIASITSLLFDDVKWDARGKMQSVPAAIKKDLIETYTLTRREGIQIITEGGKWKVLLKGKTLDVSTPEAIEQSRKAVTDFLNTKSKNKKGIETQYNIREGQFRFGKPKSGNTVQEFEVTDGVLSVKNVSFEEHVSKNATLEVVPNEENKLVFLNGYFTFSLPAAEKQKLGLDINQKSIITPEDQVKTAALKPSVSFDSEKSDVMPTKKQKLKQWVKDYYLKSKEATQLLGSQITTTSKIIATNKANWDNYSEAEQAQIGETFTNIVKVVPQLAAFLAPVPGVGTALQILKAKNESINKILSYTSEALEEYNELQKTDASNIEDHKAEVKPQERVEQTKKGRGPLSKGMDLYMAPFLSMKATPEAIKEAKDWFEKSPLSKYVSYEEMFDVVNSNGWASFSDATIRLFAGANHTALYHEAWHAFSQHYLTKEQKRELYGEIMATPEGREAVRKAKTRDPYYEALAIEELIAEDFRQYMLSGGTKVLNKRPVRNTIFRRILNFLKELFGAMHGTILTTPKTYKLTELYEKLRVGKLNEYTPSQTNVMFTESALYKTIEPVEGETTQINDQDALLLVDSIDSIISDIIDAENAANGNTMFTSALFTMPNKIIPGTSQTLLGAVYDTAYDVLATRKGEFEALAEEANPVEAERYLRKATLIQDALRNWGDPSQVNGMIAFHMQKSPFISAQLKDIDKETFAVTESDVEASRFDKSGNELSMMDLASNQVLYIVKSLREYKDGEPIQNSLGFNKLADYRITWRKLVNTLTDSNDSPRAIKEALEKGSQSSPWMRDLLDKLGDVNSKDASTFDMWTQFWSAFYMANWPLYQVSVNEISNSETGEKDFEILTGYASAVFRQVERDFRSHFKSAKNLEFIKDSGRIGNVLDYKVLDKHRGKLQTPAGKIAFLNDIGFPIANTKSIRDGLDSVRVDFIFDKLEKLRGKRAQITDIIKALKDVQTFETKGAEGLSTIETIASETSNVNKLLNLQARYSGLYANTAVSTADGNTKYEQTQMSTLSVLQNAINKVGSFQELIAMPHMAHLSYENNPHIRASIWMKSIFEFDENTQTFGKKITGVRLAVDDLSGTQNIVDESYADYDYSSSTSKSDRYTRLLQDIYSGLLGGRFSTMVHADKSTTLSVRVTDINSGPQSESKTLYIDIADFLSQGSEANLAIEHAYDLLMPYLDAELARIAKVKAQDGSIPSIPGYTVENSKGIITGDKLSIFDGVFQETTKTKILEAGSVANLSPELQTEMLKEMREYFNFSFNQTKMALGDMLFIDNNMLEFLERETKQKLSSDKAKTLMLSAYTLNTFIHHVESLNLLYGDLAQYNMLKEEFHKRNAGIASTGRMFRTDQDAIDYVNQVLGRPSAEKAGHKVKQFDGTLDAVIFQENTRVSKMVDHPEGVLKSEYGKVLNDYFNKKYKGLPAEEKQKKVQEAVDRVLDPYLKMDEGDAQGWITFDAYRILSKLEGRWSREQEVLFMQIINNPDSINMKQLLEYFPPRKYQYFGPLATKGVSATAFHKFSLFPLIPSVVKGKNLEVIHDNLMRQGADYALFQSGSKVSTIVEEGTNKANVLYSDPANRTVATNVTYTKNTVHLQYLKDQLDVNSHFKGKVIFATQLRKLIEEGLVEGGVPVDFNPELSLDERRKLWAATEDKETVSPFYKLYKSYEDKIAKLIEFRKAELRREIGWDEKDLASGKGDLSKLISFIQKELTRQDLADHEVDFIKVDEDGNLVHDLSISLSASKIERALNAIVNQRLVRQKVNGEPLVQLSSSLLEATNPTEEEKARWGTNDLNTYRVDPVTGKTLPIDIKVALQGNFENLIHLTHKDGKRVAVYTVKKVTSVDGTTKVIKEINEVETIKRLNETIQDPEWRANKDNLDIITMVGVRIPVQGLNSMEFMAVWEFLPKEAGNIIVPPSEIVAKSGSDFDIDKLTVMMPNIVMVGGAPEVIREVENNKSHDQNLDRIKEINDEIKVLRKEKSEVQNSYNEQYKNLPKAGLTEEESLELKQIQDEFYSKIRENKKDINNEQDNMTRLLGYEKRTARQNEMLDQSWGKLDALYAERDTLEIEHKQALKNFGSEVYKSNLEKLQDNEGAKLKSIVDKINELTRLKAGLNSGGIENSTMFKIRDILEMPHNFVSLITPNDTSLVMPIAKSLSDKRDYKATMGAFGQTKNVSPTRVLEPAYNIYKHESNAVGKETLGLGAVDNTYNTVFNRIGAYMNPAYETETGAERRATILMKHHTLEILSDEEGFLGQRGISLSHLYDANNENKIADVINQLMNGWVDVAKDAWIFDIQGNKQVTPVLMFLLQAGVPLESAVYFVSNPLVKEYVREQKVATSAFAKALGKQAEEFSFYRSKARYNVLRKLGLHKVLNDVQEKPNADKLYKLTVQATTNKDYTDLGKAISAMTLDHAVSDKNAIGAFLHYLELEELSKPISNLKMKLNYDTSKSTTLFDAQKREAELSELLMDSKIPYDVVKGILDESPIGAFRVAPFQLQVWGRLFKFRNNDLINRFLIGEMSDPTSNKKMKKVYGSTEKYVEEFKNDFISLMFADAVKSFDINEPVYKGAALSRNTPVEFADQIGKGVVAIQKDGETKIYIDKEALDLQYDNALFDPESKLSSDPRVAEFTKQYGYSTFGLAPVSSAAFMTYGEGRNEYYRFAIEREYLRATMPFKQVSKTPFFDQKLQHNMFTQEALVNESLEDFQKRMLVKTYEEILRDRALDNILNYWKLFNSDSTFADQLFELKEIYPSLAEDYNLVSDFIISEGSKVDRKKKQRTKGQSFTNLALRDSRVSKDVIEVYHNNLIDLSTSDVVSIPDVYNDPEVHDFENRRVAEFFNMMPYIAFLQSGLNASDSLSLVRIMPTTKIAEVITEVAPKFEKILETKGREFLEGYRLKFNALNNPSNIAVRRRLKAYTPLRTGAAATYNITNSNLEPAHRIPMNFEDGQGGRSMKEEFRGKSTFDLIVSGERTATSRSNPSGIKKGDIVEFYKNVIDSKTGESKIKTVLVEATTNEYPISMVGAQEWSDLEGWDETRYNELVKKDYVQFQFRLLDLDELTSKYDQMITVKPDSISDLESLIKNNPNVIFVLEGAMDPKAEGFYAQGIGLISKFDNVLPITLRKDLSGKVSSAFTREETPQNIEVIKQSLDRIEKLYYEDESRKIAFLDPSIGYGSYLTGAVDPQSNQMRAQETFNYLTTELYKKFKYKNKYSKIVEDVKTMNEQVQDLQYQLEIPIEDLIEAQQRLTCNL